MFVSLHPCMVDWRLSWREMAQLAARTGYAGIDMLRGSAVGEDPGEARAFFDGLGIRPVMYPLPDESELEHAARFAAAIGCTGMSRALPASTEWPKAEAARILGERLRHCARVLEQHGLRLTLEFLGPLHLRRKDAHEFIWNMGDALEFAAACGHGTGILLDAWHWHHSGGTAEQIVAAGAGSIIHVHVSDALPIPAEDVEDMHREMPGRGNIDFSAFFSALRSVGYGGGVSPEVFSRGMKELTPEEGARQGLECTRRIMNC